MEIMGTKTIITDVSIPSESMGKDVPASIILPDAYDGDSTNLWPVVYVLHGTGGSPRRYIDEASLGFSSYANEFSFTAVALPYVFSFFRTYFDTGRGNIVAGSMK